MTHQLLEKLLDVKHQGLMNEKQILDQIAALGKAALIIKPRKPLTYRVEEPEFKSPEWLEKNS